jgi:soluble lytic murein transglycosylase-like protein
VGPEVRIASPRILSQDVLKVKDLTKFAIAMIAALLALPAWGAQIAILHNGFSVPHERHVPMGAVTRLYLSADDKGYVDVATADIDHFEDDLSVPAEKPDPLPQLTTPPPKPTLSDVVTATGFQHRIDPDLISSVIHAESNFNPHARSPKGAQGLMQLMPQTAQKLGVADAYDSQANVDGGTRYLKQLLELYHYDLVKALAAYNAGPQRVSQYRDVPPYRETQLYIRKIILDYNRKKLVEQKAAAAAPKAARQKQTQTSAAVQQNVAGNSAPQATQ